MKLLFEFGIDLNMIEIRAEKTASRQVLLVFALLFALSAAFLVVLHSTLRSLATLKDGVEQLTSGNMEVRIPIHSRDELGDISTAFNLMAEYVNQKLKEGCSYNRFVPVELLRLLGKNTAKAVLGDKAALTLAVSRLGISDIFKNGHEKGCEHYDFCYRKISDVIGRVGGFLPDTSGLCVFEPPVRRALEASLEICESLRDFNAHAIHDFGEVSVLLTGKESRIQVVAASDISNRLQLLQYNIRQFGANVLVTGSFFRALGSSAGFRHRYLGMVSIERYMLELYDFFDADSEELFRLKEKTLSDFNDAISFFYENRHERARDKFIRVLRVFPEDAISRRYLPLCDKEGEACLTIARN